MSNMIEAVRADEKVGRGSCSVIDECYTDAELADLLAREGAATPAEAVKVAREIAGIWNEVYEDRTAEARREAEAERADLLAAFTEYVPGDAGCSWLIEVRREFGPDQWPDSPADLTMIVECGAPADDRGLCDGHRALVEMPEMEFEAWAEGR